VLTLPKIDAIEPTPEGLRLHFVVRPDLEYFDGHFPAVPMLPGVVQIGWALELARLHFASSREGGLERFGGLSSVKFTRVIQPGDSVSLTLAVIRESGELAFEYRAGDRTCSSGRVRFH
jgi:3-hydroxymyristoyl/3-hydroxydecanoyl-(acyl carrier protein) dehydratase